MTWIPRTLGDLCDPAQTALLVYDMQVGICGQVEGGAAIVENCRLAIAAARAARMRIVYTRHLSVPRPWMGLTQLRTAMAWQRADPDAVKPWFLRGATASEIMPAIAPEADDLVLDKLAMSAFEGTPLSFALRDCGLTGIAICGIAMEIGIEPTVRHATDPDPDRRRLWRRQPGRRCRRYSRSPLHRGGDHDRRDGVFAPAPGKRR